MALKSRIFGAGFVILLVAPIFAVVAAILLTSQGPIHLDFVQNNVRQSQAWNECSFGFSKSILSFSLVYAAVATLFLLAEATLHYKSKGWRFFKLKSVRQTILFGSLISFSISLVLMIAVQRFAFSFTPGHNFNVFKGLVTNKDYTRAPGRLTNTYYLRIRAVSEKNSLNSSEDRDVSVSVDVFSRQKIGDFVRVLEGHSVFDSHWACVLE